MTCLASGIVLFRREPDGARLLVLRHRDLGHWGFAKGRRDEGDRHEVHTAEREVAEETGYTGLRLDPGFRCEIAYRVSAGDDAGVDKRVVYFLAEAPAHEPRLSDEHVEARWVPAGELDRYLAHDALRGVARAAIERLLHAP